MANKDWVKQVNDWQNKLKQNDGRLLKEIQTKATAQRYHQYIFQELMKVAGDNMTLFSQISQYLMTKNINDREKFYHPVIFNQIIKLSKEAKYKEALELVHSMHFESLNTDGEIRLVLQLVQQILYISGKINAGNIPELDLVLKQLEIAIPYIRTSNAILLETFELFLKKRSTMTILIQAQGCKRLKSFLSKLFSEDFRLYAGPKAKIEAAAFTYLDTIVNLCLQHPDLDGIDLLVAQRFNFLQIDLLLTYLNFLHKNRSAFDLISFVEFDAAVKNVKDTRASTVIESAIIIVSTFKEVCSSLKTISDGNVALSFMRLIQRLVNIVKNYDGNYGNIFCRLCTGMKRHAIVSVLCDAVDIFTKVGQNIFVMESHGMNMVTMLQFTFKALEGLTCESTVKYGRIILVHMFNMISCYRIFDKIPEVKLNIVELFRSNIKIYPNPTLDSAKILRCYSIGYEGCDSRMQLDALCMNFLIEPQLDHTQACTYMSFAVKTRKEIPELVDQSIARIISRKEFQTFDMRLGEINVPKLLLLEMEQNFRSYPPVPNLGLFNELRAASDNDVELLAIGLFMFDIEEHKLIAENDLKFIEKGLCRLDTVHSHLGLAIIKYRRYIAAFDQLQDEFKNIKSECVDGESYATSVKVVERFSVANEETVLIELRESFEHFKRGFVHCGSNELDSRYSCMKIVKMLENISAHFRMRNYAYEAMEVQLFACKVANMRAATMEWPILHSYSVFLEDIDQFMVMPEAKEFSVAEIVDETYKMVIKHMKTFETLKIYRQSVIMSVLLSLARYYIRTDKRNEAKDLLVRFKEADKMLIELHQQNESIFRMQRIRYYLTLYEMVEAVTQSSLSLHLFAFFIIQEFGEIKDYRTEYSVHLPTLMFKTVIKMGTSGLCRSDTSNLESYVMMIYKYAMKFGLSMRCVQILNLIAQIGLARENLSDTENKLQCLNAFCNFETPCIETVKSVSPLNFKAPVFVTPTLECEVVRRDASHYQPAKTRTPPEAMSGLKKYLILENTSAQMQFYSFLIGAAYARLLYMNDDFMGAMNFYQLVQKFWPKLNTKLLAAKIPELVNEFRFFSYVINTQYCHCLLALKRTSEALEAYEAGKELLDDKLSIVDDDIVMALMTNEKIKSVENLLPTFEVFESSMKPAAVAFETPRVKARIVSRTTTKKAVPSTAKKFPVYVDSPDKSAQKKRLQYSATKKSTLETSSTENTALSLQEIPTTKRLPKSSVSKLPPSKVASKVKKTQLKFSPSVNDDVVVVVDDSENESPNRTTKAAPKTPTKANDSIVNASMETPVMGTYSARRAYRTRKATTHKS